jgi:hypothetical protein
MKNELECYLISATRLNVLVAYDNLRAGIKAKNLCDRLAQRLLPSPELRIGFWSLAALELPGLTRAMLDEAADADLLIMAVNGDQSLPTPVRRSVARCLRRVRANGGALVAQLYGILRMDEELSPAHACLKGLARAMGVDFFSEVVDPREDDFERRLQAIQERADLSALRLGDARSIL